jgi:RecA/RadA recombinase
MNEDLTTFSEYGKSFQEKVLQALMVDKTWAAQMFEVMKIEYFDLKYLKFLTEKYFSYYSKYKVFPTMQLLITIVRDSLKQGSDIILRDQIIDFLHRIKTNPDVGDLQYVKEKSLDFCRKQALKCALESAVDLIATDKLDNVLSVIKSALIAGTTPSLGHDFIEDFDSRFINIRRNTISTGITELDKRDILNGGLGNGEIGVVVGNTGTGKSHFLVDRGAAALLQGKNVLHYTFELSETAVGIRYDSNLCDISSGDVVDSKNIIKAKYENMNLGRLIIKEYPTGSATVMTIRAHIEKLILKGFEPDIILVDYADVMRSTRKFDSLRHELKLIYEELRNLAMDISIPIWTASQANRASANSDVVGLENMSEAYGKAMVADIVLSISRKPVEKASGHARLFIAKNRAGRDGIVFNMIMDTSKSKFNIIDNNEIGIQDIEAEKQDDMKKLLKAKWQQIGKSKSLKLLKITEEK